MEGVSLLGEYSEADMKLKAKKGRLNFHSGSLEGVGLS